MIRKLGVNQSRYQVYSSLFKKTAGFVALGMKALPHQSHHKLCKCFISSCLACSHGRNIYRAGI